MAMELTPEQQDERDKIILEVMGLGYLINRTTDYCVFVDYSGHVDNMRIEICESKSRYNDQVAFSNFKCGYLETLTETMQDPNGWLKMKRDMLKEIAAKGEVDTSGMMREVEHVYHHYF